MSITHYQDYENQNQITNKTVENNTRAGKEVYVRSLWFANRGGFKSFPKQVTIDNQDITFVETGMRYLLQKGQSMVQLFDMSDGVKNYRLQFDTTNFTWTLLNVSNLNR